MSIHVPSPIPSAGPGRPDNWLFDLLTAGEASFDYSLLPPLTPEPDGFFIAFALSPKLFVE